MICPEQFTPPGISFAELLLLSLCRNSLPSAEAPAGYPHQNSNNRKNRKRAGDDGEASAEERGVETFSTIDAAKSHNIMALDAAKFPINKKNLFILKS